MRPAVCFSAAVLLVVGFVAVHASDREKATDNPPARKFVVECRLVSEEPPKKD